MIERAWHSHSLAYIPGRNAIAVGVNPLAFGIVHARDLGNGKALYSFRIANASLLSLMCSPDGKLISVTSPRRWDENENQISLHAADSGRFIARFQTGQPEVLCLEFSPDSMKLASGSSDGTTVLWDMHSQMAILRLSPKGFAIRTLAFSRDGKVLATEGPNWSVSLWEIATGKDAAVLLGTWEKSRL